MGRRRNRRNRARDSRGARLAMQGRNIDGRERGSREPLVLERPSTLVRVLKAFASGVGIALLTGYLADKSWENDGIPRQ